MKSMENGLQLCAVILTYNEEQHIARCIESTKRIASSVLVVDSYSTDRTVAIATSFGAHVLQHKWHNHSTQFNWALEHIPENSAWVFRIDADEVVTDELASSIAETLPTLPPQVVGAIVRRLIVFQGRPIRHGGIFPNKVLRLFRKGMGRSEHRWMDEHITVAGESVELSGELVDDNRNTLTWWVAKHNAYASLEAIELLNLNHRFLGRETESALQFSKEARLKRAIKEKIYARLPRGLRAFAYFFYRYFFRAGFLDGATGTTFHFLQAFWYRFLVDAKVAEVEAVMKRDSCRVQDAIREVLKIDVFDTSSR